MYLVEKFKSKSIGYYLVLGAAAISLIIAIIYLSFGVSSKTFNAWIFIFMLLGIALGIGLFFFEKYPSDFMAVVMVVFFTIPIGMFITDSIGDFTEYFTGVGMYGDAGNFGMRVFLIIMMFVPVIIAIASCFFKREKVI